MAEAWPRAGMALHFGIRVVAGDKDKLIGELDAGERHVNAAGIVHGGAYMAFADEFGGQMAASTCRKAPHDDDRIEIQFLPRLAAGPPPGQSVALHVGRRTIVVQTAVYTPDGKRAALVTQTQLVIPRDRNPAPK